MINKPSGTLTLAGTIRTTHNWTYTAGTLDAGHLDASSSPAARSPARHTLNVVDFRATTSIAAGTTLTVAGSLSLTDGSLNGTGTLAAQGADQPGLDDDRRHGHPADQRRRRPDAHGRRHDRRRRPAPSSSSTSPPGTLTLAGTHPDRQQLDVHRGDRRPGHVHSSSSPAARSAQPGCPSTTSRPTAGRPRSATR